MVPNIDTFQFPILMCGLAKIQNLTRMTNDMGLSPDSLGDSVVCRLNSKTLPSILLSTASWIFL